MSFRVYSYLILTTRNISPPSNQICKFAHKASPKSVQKYVVLMDWLTQMETFSQIVDRLGLNHPVIFLKKICRIEVGRRTCFREVGNQHKIWKGKLHLLLFGSSSKVVNVIRFRMYVVVVSIYRLRSGNGSIQHLYT